MSNRKLKVLELFSGTECMSNAFRERGHECFTVDWDEQFPSSLHIDVEELTSDMILKKFGKPDILFAGTDCFVKGNLVWTSNGYKNIEDINCNDYVLTHKGNYKRVYRTMKQSHTNMCEVKISGSEMIECTTNHPFYARKKHRVNTHKNGEVVTYTELLKPEWVKAEDLTSEYRVGIPINTNSTIPNWNGVVISKCNKYGIYESHIENTLKNYLDNKDFWWIIGRYIGDGSMSIDKNHIDICCAMDEIQEIKEVIDRLGIKYTERDQNIHHFNIFSKEWCEFLKQFGVGALNKTITPLILDLPKDLLVSFVDGYISADGHWDNSLTNPCCTITTISKKLAYGMQLCLLKAYGRYCSMVVRNNQNDEICGRKVHVNKAYIIGFYKEETNRLQYKIEDNMAWVNVRYVEVLPSIQTTTYNLSVEDDESYTVNNISVHNCTTYSVAAVSKNRRLDENGIPQAVTEYGKKCDRMNRHVRDLARELDCELIIENPRAMMRKMDFVQDLIRNETTYCQWGFPYMKPTDFFATFNLHLKPPCHNGDPCHERAPRGSRSGLQGVNGKVLRSIYPKELCDHIVLECEKYINTKDTEN